MKKGDTIFNTRNNKKVRVSRLVRMNADEMEVINQSFKLFSSVVSLYKDVYMHICMQFSSFKSFFLSQFYIFLIYIVITVNCQKQNIREYVMIVIISPLCYYLVYVLGYIRSVRRWHLCSVWCGLCWGRHICQQRKHATITGQLSLSC